MSHTTSRAGASAGDWQDSSIGILGLGHHFPATVVDNDLDNRAAGNAVDERILGEIGVRRLHRCGPDETVLDLAVAAAGRAVADAAIDPGSLDLVILSNWTEHVFRPELAPLVATEIGAKHAMAFDISAGCSGFVLGVQTAAAYLASPMHYRRALVVSSEQFSRRVRPGSRAEAVAGDGAGAAVVVRGAEPVARLIDSVTHVDGTLVDLTTATPPDGRIRSRPELVEEAIAHIAFVTAELLERNGLAVDDVSWFIPHAATKPILDGIIERTGIPAARFVTNFEYRGNLSSACVPTVLSEYHKQGRFSPGDLVVSPVVAGGFFFGGLLLRF